MPEHVTLNALSTFRCLAGDCPDSCCVAAWDIDVETDTYEKWQALLGGELRDALLASALNKTRRGQTIKILAKNEAGKCQHFNHEGLCTVQTQLGADYLPHTCQEYPRMRGATAGMRLSSATLSCPEIARLVLFGDGGPASTFSSESLGTLVQHSGLDAEGHIAAQLQRLTQNVLDAGKFPLNVKIYYLGRTLVTLALQSRDGNLDERVLTRIVDDYRKDLFDLNVAIKHRRIRPQDDTAGAFWEAIYVLGKDRHLFDDRERRDCALIRAFDDDGREPSQRYADIARQVGQSRDAARPHIRAHLDVAFTNYLRASFMNNGFPWNPLAGNYIATFINCIIPFALIQLRLWIAADDQDAFTPEAVRDVVYKTERGLGHNTLLYDHLEANSGMLQLDRYLDCLVDIY